MKPVKTVGLTLFVLLTVFLAPRIAVSGEAFKTFTLTRSAGPTNQFSLTVNTAGYTGPFTMSLVNGDGSTISTAVTSAAVAVDNVEVVAQRDLSKQVHEIDNLALNLASGDNSVKVRLDGEPNSYMTLTFYGVPVAPVQSAPPMANFRR